MPTLYVKTYNSDRVNQHYLQRMVVWGRSGLESTNLINKQKL